MQGEGQEFESPRLHHHLGRRRRHDTTEQSGPIPEPPHPSTSPGPCPEIEPLIRVLPIGRPRTSGSLGGGSTPVAPTEACFGGPHLNNWIGIGRLNESSISPSQEEREPDPVPATDRLVRGWMGSSYKGHEVDALAPRADEGRGRLRKASGSREQTLIRRCPNGETRLEKSSSPLVESNRPGGGKPAN